MDGDRESRHWTVSSLEVSVTDCEQKPQSRFPQQLYVITRVTGVVFVPRCAGVFNFKVKLFKLV